MISGPKYWSRLRHISSKDALQYNYLLVSLKQLHGFFNMKYVISDFRKKIFESLN